MNTGPQIPPPGRSNSSRNAASMVHSPALNARSRNLKNPLNAALASQRSSSSRPVAGLSDDEDDRGGKQDPLGDVEDSHPLRAAEPPVGGCADASPPRQFGSVARPNRPPRVPSSDATSTERHGRCLSSRADRRARVLNDCAERGRSPSLGNALQPRTLLAGAAGANAGGEADGSHAGAPGAGDGARSRSDGYPRSQASNPSKGRQ